MSNFRLRLFDRVETGDSRMHIRQFGYVRTRPDHPQGDSVNVIAFGGRLDDVSEFVDQRRDKADADTKTKQDVKPDVTDKSAPAAA